MESLRPVTLPVATFASRQKGHGACHLFKTHIIIPETLGALGKQHLDYSHQYLTTLLEEKPNYGTGVQAADG